MTKYKILIVTHSTPTGLNQRQAMECANLIGFTKHDLTICLNPEEVEDISIFDKIIMIVPEWNCSFPWTFKKMIDDSGYPSKLQDRKVLLIGTSNTTFGNIIGISHLSHVLNWVGATVVNSVCVPFIQDKFANDNIIVDERLNNAILVFANC